jgi:hypothetical protein
MERHQQQLLLEVQTEAHLVWALSLLSVVAAVVDTAAMMPTPGVLEVADLADSVVQEALSLRKQCRQALLHLETGVETLLAGGTFTLLAAAAQALLVAIDLMRVTCLPRVAQV